MADALADVTQGPAQPFSRVANGVRLKVRLTPKAARDAVGGAADVAGTAVLIAHVRAAPRKGAANAALLALVAEWLSCPKARVSLAGGGRSRVKTVAVAGDPAELAARIARLLARQER